MNRLDFVKFQTRVTTGSTALPVALAFWALFALAGPKGWEIVQRLGAGLVTAYLLIELNTAYSLIRQRTTLHLTAFLLLMAAGYCLPVRGVEEWVAPLFVASLHQLFSTYEADDAPTGAFNALCFVGLGSFLFPPMAWLVPAYVIGLYQMRALSLRSVMGALLGFATPWWIYYGAMYCFDEEHLTAAPLRAVFHLATPAYGDVPGSDLLLWGVMTGGALVSGIHYLGVSYQDKVRTRLHLSYLLFLEIVLTAMAALQPAYEAVLWGLMVPLVALLTGHLFTLTRTRAVSRWFVALTVVFLLIPFITLWIVSYSS